MGVIVQGTTSQVARQADPRLLAWLAENDVDHDVHQHTITMTASDTARAEKVDPHTFAKTVVVTTSDGRRALVALEATDRLDVGKAAHALAAAGVRLLTEHELIAEAPDLDPGAWPPVGALFDMPVIADHALREDPAITFSAGSHGYAVRVDRAAWEKAADVTYADIAEDQPGQPPWMH